MKRLLLGTLIAVIMLAMVCLSTELPAQQGLLPENAAAPTCQTCHMQDGNHEVRTAWGFMAMRLPMPDDKKWAEARELIFKAYGVLNPDGNPGARRDLAKAADVMRFTREDWERERHKMVSTCRQCHSSKFAEGELKKGDKIIREADILLAEAIQIVANLYADGILKKPANYAFPFPDLLTFHDAPTTIEQRLFVMFKGHRMRTFQGAFHANPDYAYWYGLRLGLAAPDYFNALLGAGSALFIIGLNAVYNLYGKARTSAPKS
jgi:cytochrome c553